MPGTPSSSALPASSCNQTITLFASLSSLEVETGIMPQFAFIWSYTNMMKVPNGWSCKMLLCMSA